MERYELANGAAIIISKEEEIPGLCGPNTYTAEIETEDGEWDGFAGCTGTYGQCRKYVEEERERIRRAMR